MLLAASGSSSMKIFFWMRYSSSSSLNLCSSATRFASSWRIDDTNVSICFLTISILLLPSLKWLSSSANSSSRRLRISYAINQSTSE